jgi:hypothetical protein
MKPNSEESFTSGGRRDEECGVERSHPRGMCAVVCFVAFARLLRSRPLHTIHHARLRGRSHDHWTQHLFKFHKVSLSPVSGPEPDVHWK